MKKYHSIFNDVLGPIMTGPSSSHTAGCARIGKMIRILYGNDIEEAEIIFEKNGSYPSTYKGQGTDYGFVGGLLGFSPNDIRLKHALKIAEESNLKITFKSEDLGMNHPNEAEIRIYRNKKLDMKVITRSTGGGTFEIINMDDFDISITGENKKIYISTKENSLIQEIKKIISPNHYYLQKKNNTILLEILIINHEIENKIKYLKNDNRIIFYRTAEVILPVTLNKENIPLFFNAAEAIEYNKSENLNLWELAIKYECSISNISKNDVVEKMKNILFFMKKSLLIDIDNKNTEFQILSNNSAKIENKLKNENIIDMGVLNKIMLSAVKTMENNCKHNIIVAAPTAGSCGVIPATIVYCGEKINVEEDKIIKALLTSGLIGVFIANQSTFSAEVAGCQAENGAASCMAAAGIIELLDGNIEECFSAASLALQNLLGLICDPVGGLTEVPCISRNVLASINAVSAANMIKCGYDAVIPLDEVITAMYEVGKMLPNELKCTCKGGLCNTKTGKEIYNKIKKYS